MVSYCSGRIISLEAQAQAALMVQDNFNFAPMFSKPVRDVGNAVHLYLSLYPRFHAIISTTSHLVNRNVWPECDH